MWVSDFLDGWIDPDGFWYLIRCRREAFEALRVCREGRDQRDAALFGELPVMSMVHGMRRHHGDPAVTMHSVVPAEEHLAVRSRMFDRTEARWELRPIFQGFELRLRVRVVVGDMGTTVRFDHVQVHEERRYRL